MSPDRTPAPTFHTVSIDAETPLRALAQRRDIPRALMEACDAFLGHGASPQMSLLEAAASRDLPSVLTALLALDAEVGVEGDWQPLSNSVVEQGGLALLDRGAIQRVRLSAVGDPQSGDHTSSYREVISVGALVGVATDVVWSPSNGSPTRERSKQRGPIASAHVTICGAAAQPLRARQVEATLRGRRPSAELIQLASETAAQEAQPFGIGTTLDPTVLAAVRDITRQALTASLL